MSAPLVLGKRSKKDTSADNARQGAAYLEDILKGPPFRTTPDAWAKSVAAAAEASGNNGWQNLTVRDEIEKVMVAFTERGHIAPAEAKITRFCESQLAALRVGFIALLQPKFSGTKPEKGFFYVGTFGALRAAVAVNMNEGKKARGVGHVSNRNQRFTSTDIVAWAGMARADVEGNNPYGAYTVWIDVLVSQHGNRSHQWDGACWGQLDCKPVGGGPGSKPTFATGHRLYELRTNTERKAAQTQNCEALFLLISHKNPDLCAVRAIGEKELYLRVTEPAGLAKTTCKLEDWLTPQGSFRPASVTPLRASQYCETSTISGHGKALKEYASQAGLDPIGGPVFAMRNFVVQATGGCSSVEPEAARHLTLHSSGRDATKRDTSYSNEHISALLATIGYGTGLARESCCAHHRVLHFYLGTNAGREAIVYLLSRLLPATEWEQRCAAMKYEGSNVKVSLT